MSRLGRYEVLQAVGTGSMGKVFRARDPRLDRDVAIKVLRDDLRIPEDVRESLRIRMLQEARAAARVSHPNLVTLHDLGDDTELGVFLVFEFVDGPTLKQRIEEQTLTQGEVRKLALELSDGLTHAHDAGILHRDVKPENVILSKAGGKLADFGIARVPDSTLTLTGGLLGTPAYSAPETFRSSSFSAQSDQFSLAATLYEALYGERAFPGEDALAVAARIADGYVEARATAHGLSLDVDAIFARALSEDPRARFASCRDFGWALAEHLLAGRSVRVAQDLAAPGMQPETLASHSAASDRVVVQEERSTRPEALQREAPSTVQAPDRDLRRRALLLLGTAVAASVALGVLLYELRPSKPVPAQDDASIKGPGASSTRSRGNSNAAPRSRPSASNTSGSAPGVPRATVPQGAELPSVAASTESESPRPLAPATPSPEAAPAPSASAP